jgi:SAM-dependent methyltransferase
MHRFPGDYDAYAPTYAWTRWAVPWVVAPLARTLDRLPPGAAVLDIGCGTGNYVHALVERRSDVSYVGFDISKPMVREATTRRSRARFVVGDASRAFPFRDRVFGLTFAVDVIHHIEGLARFFSEAARVLMTGGRLVLVTDSEDTLHQRSLTHFFPEILSIELQRIPPLPTLHEHAGATGLRLLEEERAEGRIPLSDEFLRKLTAKCSSAMRLLAPSDHTAGLVRVRAAQARGESWLSCYTVLHYGHADSEGRTV